MDTKYRVWWVPNFSKLFHFEVDSPEAGAYVLDALAVVDLSRDNVELSLETLLHVPTASNLYYTVISALAKYHQWSLDNDIGPVYQNASGLEAFDDDWDEWSDWYDENGGTIDDFFC